MLISIAPLHQNLSVCQLRTSSIHFLEGSRCHSLRVTWEHGGLAHIVEAQVQHADSLQAWVG